MQVALIFVTLIVLVVELFAVTSAVCPRMISRSEWGARAPRDPRDTTALSRPVGKVFIHHTDGGSCTSIRTCSARMRSIQDYHMDDPDRRYNDIGYSFLVGGDGNVYVGRGWRNVGAHTYGYNEYYGIAFIGEFTNVLPNDDAIAAAKQLIACGQPRNISPQYTLHGHRDAGCTTCPGDRLYNLIKRWRRYDGEVPKKCPPSR